MTDKESPLRLFLIFLRLGLTSFGGPVAHIGIFRSSFVERHRWLTDRDYADLVALAQFLPGPASSQVGMGLGLMRGGIPGMAAAWLGFTLPSALLMCGMALGLDQMDLLQDSSWITGVKAAVVAVVVQALIGMMKNLSPDAPRASLAALALSAVVLIPGPWTQVAAIAVAALIGALVLKGDGQATDLKVRISLPIAITSLILFFALLLLLPVLAIGSGDGWLALFDAFYRSGALVFGGGHVVLPLLQRELVDPGIVSPDAFLSGYAGAQIVPGPMFSIASHLGALTSVGPNDNEPSGIAGAALATIAIFLPSALLMLGALPFWASLSRNGRARAALSGAAAAVVGLLGAALYDPVFVLGVTDARTLVLAVTAYLALAVWKLPVWAVIPAAGVVGAFLL